MPRDWRAYLADIVESCDAIESAVRGLDLAAYQGNRLVRSSVEREFIIVGEAITALSRLVPNTFERNHACAPDRRLPQSADSRVPSGRRRPRVGDC
jgi:uncharacterized protein with HEPN domain